MEKPPWLVEWGGGASIENPHVQRVHYCELLVRLLLCTRPEPIPTALPPVSTELLASCALLRVESGDRPVPLQTAAHAAAHVAVVSICSHSSPSDAAQVRDFLQRVKCKRFPSIEKDMKMVLAHCGSLFLDPAALCQVSACVLRTPTANLVDEVLSVDNTNWVPSGL